MIREGQHMAKKREPDAGPQRVIKLRLSSEELRRLRIAAAIEDCRSSELLRRIVLSAVAEILKKPIS